MAARNLIPVLVLAVMLALPLVHADGPYVIPLEGIRWASSTIPVYVSGGEAWQQNQTLEALQIWNLAQAWFARNYFPNSSVYQFEIGDSSAPVQVLLLDASTVMGSIQGWTDYQAQNGVVESAKVKIAARNSMDAVLTLSVHELGHVLGLGHVSCCETDLMNTHPVTDGASPLPTTLDLYAVHVLAEGLLPNLVWLPNNIPYRPVANGELAAPEFPNLLIILLAAPCLILARRSKSGSG